MPYLEDFFRGGFKGGTASPLLRAPWQVLQESWDFDTIHRRAGGHGPVQEGYKKHADAHKYCPGLSCGVKRRPATTAQGPISIRSAQIVAWRKAKAAANRRYLEENVYGRTKAGLD